MAFNVVNYPYSGEIKTHTINGIGLYMIECWGAEGGTDSVDHSGKGAYAKSYLKVTTPNYDIKVLSGEKGGWGSSAGGGGGGTFVTDSSNKPICIAGGGGGRQQSHSVPPFAHGQADTSGGTNHSSYPGGTKGNGGKGNTNNGASGGGGLNTNGGTGTFGTGGNAFVNGGAKVKGSNVASATGGFGGGGSTHGNSGGGGGGGGYSGGGGGGDHDSPGHGGGGGSYHKSDISLTSMTIGGDSDMPIPDGGTQTGHRGNGHMRISKMSMTPTITVKSKNNTSIVLTINYMNYLAMAMNVKATINGSVSTIHSTSSASTSAIDVTVKIPSSTQGTLKFEISNGVYSTVLNYVYDNTPPVVSFPNSTYVLQKYEGDVITLFEGTDTTDTSIDYDYKVYINDQLYTEQLNVKGNTLKLPYFDNMTESYQLKVEVRAKQSSDTPNGTGQDVWSEWYTSPTITIKSPVIFAPNFTNIKWYQDIEQQAIISPYNESTFETQHYCNGELYTTTQHSIGLTPPLLYTPIKPHLWSYEYYAITRVRNAEGVWSDWYKSPTVEVQFNIQPNDVEFSKELPPYFIQGETTTIEWGESTDPNDTKTTYTVSLVQDTTTELFKVVGVEEPRLTFTVPSDVVSNNITFNVVAYSDGLYSNPVSSPRMAITDVKIMDCTLNFPTLNTNVLGEFTELQLVINGDKRIVKTENFVDYTLPLHYFRSGANTLTLVAIDRNDVKISRTWNVNLNLNIEDLVIKDKVIDVKGYLSFNYDPQENYVECTELFKPNLDLGVVEHELYGSTPFEGANTITQKLVINRKANDDISQLRTLKITGAIE